MNIQQVKQNSFINLLQQKRNNNANNNTQTHFGLKLSKPLTEDKVSFQGSKMQIKDFVTSKVEKDNARLTRVATTFLDVLESISSELKDKGVSFNRKYCEGHPIKSASSYVSKICRSGSFAVRDWIRATLFLENPYDLSTLSNDILPALQKRGFVLADLDIPLVEAIKKGYTPTEKELKQKSFTMKDLDIRLVDAQEKVDQTSPELKYFVGNVPKSGYEDIQMRLIRDFDPKKTPLFHELIILFGNNYAKAKKIESDFVYSQIRELDELQMLKKGDLAQHTRNIIEGNLDIIKSIYRCNASVKLFENAKNKDYRHIDQELPISFSEDDKKLIKNTFDNITKIIRTHYSEQIKKARGGAITANKKAQASDIKKIGEIRNNLEKAIEFFNSGEYKNYANDIFPENNPTV